MPWNDNANPGPWGSPPKDPGKDDNGGARRPGPGGGGRGPGGPRRPGGGGSGGPGGPNIDFDAFARDAQDRLRNFFGGPGGVKPGAVAAVAGAAVALWALSGLYVVQPDQEGVVTTFGAYSRSATPGLRYHLPAPFESVEKVSVTTLNRVDIGGVTDASAPEESLMLTGDENIVDLQFSVQWRVKSASDYVFNLADRDAVVKSVAESAMREVVGKTPLAPILSNGRGQVQSQARILMQSILDSYRAGVEVVDVQIRNSDPPGPVVAAYRDLQKAKQDAESSINEAQAESARQRQAAIGYSEQVVREAEGESARFNSVYEQYRLAPGVTRDRLYIETMQRVLSKSNKVVIDSKGASAPIILPPDVFRPRAGAASAVTVDGQPRLSTGSAGVSR
ncbi:MAG: HflK protein [Caulobacterales bacterium 68-7]|nr:MAG: HflK protein [Caulobacterales bacterium 68-7]